ncbi:MAG: Unknown protein [uncultured Aureispira sp.]|uniref:Uncharacterized protein n=1 Tax=uncultured Aureispira sp. TaxID=1331704 RepID=A0A6S6UEC6_9BACT|nr:MAG: Unknown protein [uncultured Aureispira sp.]
MKNTLLLLLIFSCFYTSTSTAQKEIEYLNPPSVQHQDYTIDIDHIISKEDYCKFRLSIQNNTDNYQAFDLSKVGFIYENVGTYYPKKGKIKIIPPNEKINHTIRIDGNMNYMVEQFKVSLEGLLYASSGNPISVPAKTLEAGMGIKSKIIELEIKKVTNKKGRFSFAMNAVYSDRKNAFITIDPTELKANDESNQSLAANVSNKKFLILQNDKKFSINGDFESNSTELILDWTDVITHYELSQQPKTIVPIYHTITSPVSAPVTPATPVTPAVTTRTTKTVTTTETVNNNVQHTTPRPAAQNNCSKYAGPMNGHPAKVTIYSEDGECFQIKAFGQYLNPNYASNVSFGFPIMGKVEIRMENGQTFNKSIVLNEDIYAVTYAIKKNKKGKYVTKMLLGTVGHNGPTAQELADQSAANLEKFKQEQDQKSNDQLADHRRRIAELDAKTETTIESSSSSSNSASSNNNRNNNSNNNNSSNNNQTTSNNRTNSKMPNSMHLRFMEGTSPLVNMRVEVSTASGWTGRGTTDSNGDVYIDATNLNTKNINIYAKNSNTEYKLGNVVKLDNNLFALIEPATLMLKTTNDLINAAQDGDTDAILDNMGW